MTDARPDKAPVVVFDTSVLIPLILEASASTRLFLRLQAAGWRVALSRQIIAEARRKMEMKRSVRQWLKVSDEEISRFLDHDLPRKTRSLPGVRQAHGAVPADRSDDIIIAAALEAGAAYIVTEDKHLLDLNPYRGIQIMNRELLSDDLDRLGIP